MEVRNIEHPEALKVGDLILYMGDDKEIYLTKISKFNTYKDYPGVELICDKEKFQKKLRTLNNKNICLLIIP